MSSQRDTSAPRCNLCNFEVYPDELLDGTCRACIAASFAASDDDLRRFTKEDWRA